MAEDFMIHDFVDLCRRSVEAGNRRDFDAQASIFAPDCLYVGVSGELRMRFAGVGVWTHGLMQRGTNYLDIDEACAAAERLAEERA